MLTCVNPNIIFKQNDSEPKVKGVAVALKWLFALISDNGMAPPSEGHVRQEIRALEIGIAKDKKQFFNKYANGNKISRSLDGVEVQSKTCVVIKRSAFSQESWEIFSEVSVRYPKNNQEYS
jgi:hypothetical protein